MEEETLQPQDITDHGVPGTCTGSQYATTGSSTVPGTWYLHGHARLSASVKNRAVKQGPGILQLYLVPGIQFYQYG